MKKILLATFIISFGLWSCKNKGGTPDEKPVVKTLHDSVTFSTMVLPIFIQHCNIPGCHAQLINDVDLKTNLKAKVAVETKDLLKAINYELAPDKNMPQGQPKLSQRKIDIIEIWVEKGFPE